MNTKSAQDQAERERYQDLAAEVRGERDLLDALIAQRELDEDIQRLAAEVRRHVPALGTRGGLEERLWAALDRSVYLLEARLVSLEVSDVPAYLGDAAGDAEAVRNIAETMDRLGMLKPPLVPRTRRDVWDGAAEGERA